MARQRFTSEFKEGAIKQVTEGGCSCGNFPVLKGPEVGALLVP